MMVESGDALRLLSQKTKNESTLSRLCEVSSRMVETDMSASHWLSDKPHSNHT